MTDSTDNARGPERIWLGIDRRGKVEACPDAHVQPCDDVASAYVEYIRADLAPAPQDDPRVMALVEALRDMVTVVKNDRWDAALTGRDMILQNAMTALAAFDITGGNADG